MRFNRCLAFLCVLTMILSGCAISGKNGDEKNQNTDAYSATIASLESRLSELEKEYNILDYEACRELEAIRAELDALRGSNAGDTSVTTQNTDEIFLYTQSDGKATITGYNGKDTYLAIPTQIDSYDVVKIGKSAFASSKLTCVIIGEGVESIDWFAFYNSPFLSEITIPSSVTSIGYSAFEGCSSSLTIYCSENSYAYSYAKSYGISYVII